MGRDPFMIDTLAHIPLALDVGALLRRVRLEPGTDDARAFERLVDRARAVGRPKALYAESFIEARGADTVCIGGIVFTSRLLRATLDRLQRVFPFVATCGRELDAVRLPPGDPLSAFWWDTIKTAALGCAVRHLADHLKRRFRLSTLSSMKPGSGEAEVWPIQQQSLLFALLGDVAGRIGVELTPSWVMVPTKSTSGISFATDIEFRSCQVCKRAGCPGRAAPFDPPLWDSIQAPAAGPPPEQPETARGAPRPADPHLPARP